MDRKKIIKKQYNRGRRDFDNRENNNYNENNNYIEESSNLEGRNPVLEALNHDRPIDKILVKKGEIEGTLKVIVAKAREKGIPVQEIDKHKMEQISVSHNNQGVIAICPAYEYCDVRDILQNAKDKGEQPLIVILDEITDPHNLGAIIRTAECCGAHGVIIPKRRSVGLTAIVGKTSAGAVEYMPVARVTNLAQTIDELKKNNVWVACADMGGQDYYSAPLDGALAIVTGSEGKGVSRLIKDKCDFVVGIPMLGKIQSLNASVSASIIMYEALRQRRGNKK